VLGSRYIYDLYYEKEAISRKLYDWLLKNGYADANLIAKWKKQGYEKVREGVRSSREHIC
jgi:bud site selection protein 31